LADNSQTQAGQLHMLAPASAIPPQRSPLRTLPSPRRAGTALFARQQAAMIARYVLLVIFGLSFIALRRALFDATLAVFRHDADIDIIFIAYAS